MKKEIEIPEGYEARIEGDKVIIEQKSEDERIRKYIVKFVELEKGVNLPPDDADKMLAYLEKQKIPKGSPTPDLMTMLVPNRYNEHQPAEWSEDDRKNIADFLYGINVGFTQAAAKDRAKDILSIIRPRPHWKPSEEQMLALGGCLDYLLESDNEDADIIKSLINDLKKL